MLIEIVLLKKLGIYLKEDLMIYLINSKLLLAIMNK